MKFSMPHVLLGVVFSVLALSGKAQEKEKELPRVLLLGDSISIGYTPLVQGALKGKAVVLRPMKNDKPENCSGTTLGVTEIGTWLAIDGGNWDVIHFNFGLHDLKRVSPVEGAKTSGPDDPHQADPAAYEKNLREIVRQLKATGAVLVFATTTPVPEGKVNPHRSPEDVIRYNEIAKTIMKENDIAVNDLYEAVLPELKTWQQPVNVHFTDEGSAFLGIKVTEVLEAIIAKLP